jgi:hypothetical protein
MKAQPRKVMSWINLIRVSISILIATVCLALAGCGEHAEPIDMDGPLSSLTSGMDAH